MGRQYDAYEGAELKCCRRSYTQVQLHTTHVYDSSENEQYSSSSPDGHVLKKVHFFRLMHIGVFSGSFTRT